MTVEAEALLAARIMLRERQGAEGLMDDEVSAQCWPPELAVFCLVVKFVLHFWKPQGLSRSLRLS